MKMIDHVCAVTVEYIDRMPKSKRKKYGQFFTSKETAAFMAGLFSVPKDRTSLSILDPGAGSGILSVALLERLESNTEINTIELVCYENDSNIVDLLRSNLEWACSHATKNVSFKIVTDNYILSQMLDYNSMLGANPDADKFDMVIGNPPYMKIAKDAPEAAAMSDVCYGAPNLYFLFATMSMFNLAADGEMVYIIPRSWTSGAYFKRFRKRFFEEGALEHIHLFVSRDKVFEKESVLQETIIIKAKKTQSKPNTITITTTQSNADFSNRTVFEAPYATVVNGDESYAENSREIIRKQAMHHFRNAAFIEDNGKATNSPNYRYRLTDEMLHLIQSFGTADWERSLARFMENHDSLVDLYASKRTMRKMPVKINGEDFTFSPGKHNQLQKAIIEEFAPRFAPNSECLYVGDTTEKDLVKNVDKLCALGFEITLHDKMPDVVLYSEDKDWLYFIESVTSVGPMEPKRIKEIEEMTTGVTAGKIYVTAFLDFKTFKKFSETLAWETEVWIADMPDHMIHLNGDKFLGPR